MTFLNPTTLQSVTVSLVDLREPAKCAGGADAPLGFQPFNLVPGTRVLIYLEAEALGRGRPPFAAHLLPDLERAGSLLGLRTLQVPGLPPLSMPCVAFLTQKRKEKERYICVYVYINYTCTCICIL